MRIAVTGARGRLGGQVVRLLAARPGCQVVALSRRQPPAGPQLGNVSEVRADYDDPTGPESLTLAAIASLAGETWGASIKYVSLTPAEHHTEMARACEQLWWQYAYSTMFEAIRLQRWSPLSGQVLDLTGRSPAAAREVLAQHSGQ